MSEPLLRRLAVIGLGLIGASLCRAAKTRGLAAGIAGYDADPEVRARAQALALADEIAPTAEAAAAGADLVVLAVPVGAMEAAARAVAPRLAAGALVTDAGSVKQAVIEAATPHLPAGSFVPGHPIAGTEQSGPEAGFATLFEGRWCILTPTEDTPGAAVERVASFWQGCGSTVDYMDPHHHDLVLAITSHVPHLIAYNIVGTASDLETVTESEVIKYSAGGFRDFTRIAASDPTMWRDVFLNNREAVLEMLGRFSEDLTALQRAIRWGDGDALYNLFTRTRAIRRQIIEAGQESPAPNFGREPRG
jgi:cyclohexadieny/prephenate dehydrogenase